MQGSVVLFSVLSKVIGILSFGGSAAILLLRRLLPAFQIGFQVPAFPLPEGERDSKVEYFVLYCPRIIVSSVD
jgi:hypothetical protein